MIVSSLIKRVGVAPYASTSLYPTTSVCAVKSILKRTTRQDLLDLISTPMELFDDPLDKEEEKNQPLCIRQLARLTGVSYGIIQRINEKLGRRTVT